MNLLVEVREVVFERPLGNLLLVSIGVSVVIAAVPIVFVQPPLILALEFVVQDDAIDSGVAFGQAPSRTQVRAIYLRVVLHFAWLTRSA
jgi:hypothetical protein